MDPKLIVAIAGMFLIVAGVGLIILQMFHKGPFATRKIIRIGSVELSTNVTGFGVILLGFLLMLAEMGIGFIFK